jgi:outer membrane receptor protein involved in Fe transport
LYANLGRGFETPTFTELYTWTAAGVSEAFTAGTTPIPAGNLIPGVPKSQTGGAVPRADR